MGERAEPGRCEEWVAGGTFRGHRCRRRAGYGAEGRYCRQHAEKDRVAAMPAGARSRVAVRVALGKAKRRRDAGPG